MQVDILRALARHGPLKLTHIMYKANANCSVLNEYLDSLIERELVEKRVTCNKRVVYSITKSGRTALKYFWEVNSALLINDVTAIPLSQY